MCIRDRYVLHPAGCYDMHIAGTYLKDRRPNETKYYMHGGSIPVYEYNNLSLIHICRDRMYQEDR